MGGAQIGPQLQVQRIDCLGLERQRHQIGDIAFQLGFGQPLFGRGPAAQKLVPPHDDAELHFFVMSPFGLEGPLAFVKGGHVPATPSRPVRSRKSIAPGHDFPLSAT
jgi:hypothetical protein